MVRSNTFYTSRPPIRGSGVSSQNWFRGLFRTRQNRRRGWQGTSLWLWWVPFELALVAVVVWGLDTGWRLLADPMTFPVKDVRIIGELHHIDSEALARVVVPVATGGFLRVDLREVRKAAMTMPWVNEAHVRRIWPDTLRVAVVEQVPVARWVGGGLGNERGVIFMPDPATYPVELPNLDGAEGSAVDMLGHLRRLNQVFAPVGLHVTALTVDARRAWTITLNNGIRLLLGARDLDNRLARFIRVYPSALASQADRILRIDLRYSNGFAVGWKYAT